ncbi:MAG: indolepyruvate ferredoxin oxidoreductase family protein [Rhodobacteraceae bacterium]|nr:indolepyruvate ferredoxin oxidoreductase family protein [Paracoccaceae bacterium]
MRQRQEIQLNQKDTTLRDVGLSDKYNLGKANVFATGTQVLVRLCLAQSALDRAKGKNTAGYVTGYRGSPLGAVDAQFGQAKSVLGPAGVVYEPGLNEDLAATALWGTQQAELRGDGRYDGVFGMWYGKGPGVDRSGDAFRHANLSGTSPFGGVVAVFGDDHTCESSTTSHQSEFAFVDAMIPVLNPANIQELFNYGLHGWALSRFASVWVALKCVKDNVESSASVNVDANAVPIILPDQGDMPEGGLSIRRVDPPQAQEARLHQHKIRAVLEYTRANGLNRTLLPKSDNSRIGIVTTGKSYSDTVQALAELGIDKQAAAKLGLTLFKVAMPWPLEPTGIRDFAAGLEQIIVIEEKRGLIEDQLRSVLFNEPARPIVVGKRDEDDAVLFPSAGALNPVMIADILARRLAALSPANTQTLSAAMVRIAGVRDAAVDITPDRRTPYFCAGCPHSTSTKLPEGKRGYAGIGCHWLSQFMNRGVEGYTHMGGEGANWIGESKFSTNPHMFQNVGDGTYNHSGIMAIRAAAKTDTNITFKILNNDAVALTGGQQLEGALNSAIIACEVIAAGARKTVLVSDDPARHVGELAPPAGVEILHRDQLIAVQKRLAEVPGVTVLIYEQTCAAEKRRRRKRKSFPDPARRVFINSGICESCGDCSVQSNCVAILPKDTQDGRKRQIDQSACNKDFSCLKGFCPSFVTVEGGQLRKPKPNTPDAGTLPDPTTPPDLATPYSMVITGIGGTGVVTIGAILGMAAHLEGKGCGIIDMAGLAQKGGAVASHIKIAARPADISTIRVSSGGADLILACDTLVLADPAVSKTLRDGHTAIVANAHETMTGAFIHNRDFRLPTTDLVETLGAKAGAENSSLVDATALATALMGDSIAANMFLLGFAYQTGRIPLSAEAISEAITLNGTAVAMNQSAFDWGRVWAIDPDKVWAEAGLTDQPGEQIPRSLDQQIQQRAATLSRYQNAAYANRYVDLVERVRTSEMRVTGAEGLLSDTVALTAYQLMAYKDEYEVARLHSDGRFAAEIARSFEGEYQLKYHLAPPILSRINKDTGRLQKRDFGGWILPAMRMLACLKMLRGTKFDIFGKTEERGRERAMVTAFEAQMTEVAVGLTAANLTAAVALAALPQEIRGFGPVKMQAFETYETALIAARQAFADASSNDRAAA